MPVNTDKLLKRFESIANNRISWESHWQELSDYLLPGRTAFNSTRIGGEKPRVKIYDSTGPQAANKAAAGLYSRTANPASKWFYLNVFDSRLREDEEVIAWLDKARDITQERINKALAGPMFQTDLDLIVFGTGCMFVEADDLEGLIATTFPLDCVYVAEDNKNRVDTVFRKFKMTVRQLEAEFPDAELPDDVKKTAETEPDKKLDVLHAVYPRKLVEMKADSMSPKDMPVASIYMLIDSKTLLSESGYEEMPYCVPRLEVVTGEEYGRSLGMLALSDVRTVNEMVKILLDSAHLKARPPLDVPEEAYITPLRLIPGAININQNSDGRKASAIHVAEDTDITYQILEERRAAIREIFFNDQLQLVNGPMMTATEVNKRVEMQMQLMGPWQGRLEGELFEPLIHRALGILIRKGIIPPPPQKLAGVNYGISYDSPLARAQKLVDVNVIDNVKMSVVTTVQAGKPEVADNFDWDKMETMRARAMGLPAELIKKTDDVKILRKQREDAMKEAKMAATAPTYKTMADTAKTVSEIPGGEELVKKGLDLIQGGGGNEGGGANADAA